MTNYLAMLTAVAALFAGACSAAEPPAASPATAKPATPAPAAAGARISAAPAGATGSAARFTQAPGTGSLTFSFMQAGAENKGSFRQFATVLVYDAKNPTTGSLEVTVQTASLETQDKDRNDTLASAELLDVKK